MATGFGALPILGLGRPSSSRELAFLAFAGGVMLAASLFSLILPGIAAAQGQGHALPGAILLVLGATAAGAVAMILLGRWLPVPEGGGPEAGVQDGSPCPPAPAIPRPVWILCLAIVLHNIPEGAAVGMAFSGAGTGGGLSTAIGIGVQNLPEGLAVACALASGGVGKVRAFWGGALSGMVEPVAGAAGALLVAAVRRLLPWGLGLAAGAMLLIVFAQILPDMLRHHRARRAHPGASRLDAPGFAFAGGLALMAALDVALG